MQIQLFFKLAVFSVTLSLLAYAISGEGISMLAKSIALGMALSIAITAFYPSVRGVQKGDSVMLSSSIPFLAARFGTALTAARKNKEVRVRFENGEEAVAVVEGYSGLITPPKVKLIYQERLNE